MALGERSSLIPNPRAMNTLAQGDFTMLVPSYYYAPSLPITRQGKVAELRQELNFGGKKDKNHTSKKTALKKIVANMTMSNNDMVGLFPDVVACMDIHSLEIKKM
jgi:vesicle coat complex subunit